MGDWDYEAIAASYEQVLPKYERLCSTMAKLIEDTLKREGHDLARVAARAKDPWDFVKKAYRKGYSDPLLQMGDKAGLRVIIPFAGDKPEIERLIGEVLILTDRDDKKDHLGQEKLGYPGLHFQATLRPESAPATDKDLLGLEAELQIHTKAENAWAMAAHDSLYKTVLAVPPRIGRRVMRLEAIVEVFDDEVEHFRELLAQQPGFSELRIVPLLDRELTRLTHHQGDPGISAIVVPNVVPLYGASESSESIMDNWIRPYLAESAEFLKSIYDSYNDDTRANPLLFQPEALLLFERLKRDRFRLKRHWPGELPVELLRKFAGAAGVPLD